MEEQNYDVYGLLTNLCETYSNSQNVIAPYKFTRRLRSKCYEILLSKKAPIKGEYVDMEDEDAHNKILSWVLELKMDYQLHGQAAELKKTFEQLIKAWTGDDAHLQNILRFLYQLRKVPENDSPFLGIKKSNSMFRFFEEKDFRLPNPIATSDYNFSNPNNSVSRNQLKQTMSTGIIEFVPSSRKLCSCLKMAKSRKTLPQLSDRDEGCKSALKNGKDWQENGFSQTDNNSLLNKDYIEGYGSEIIFLEKMSEDFDLYDDSINIWELVSKMKYTERRTWEDYGCCSPKNELFFISEADRKVCDNVHYLLTSTFAASKWENLKPRENISVLEFIKCFKYILVGLPSRCFMFDKEENFVLCEDVGIEGLSYGALQSYSANFIFCGKCYKGLDKMGSMSVKTQKKQGHIYTTFCDGIKKFLEYYRRNIFDISETTTLLKFDLVTKELRSFVSTLASVCKVGPFKESHNVPNGVALLNYLYQNVLKIYDNKMDWVLYSILYPCLQEYFSRFLQQWIFSGTINDPCNEFFITVNQKYISTRGRTYWTRSHTVQEDIVPDFLSGMQNEILNCGKAMNLLKVCIPNSPLCKYLMGKRTFFIAMCLTSENMAMLEQQANKYYLEALEECGMKFTFNEFLNTSKKPDQLFLNMVAQKRAVTLKRIELERIKKIEEANRKKEKEMASLKKQYEISLLNKELQKAEEMQRELRLTEANLELERLRQKLIQKEAKNIIDYYDKLCEESDRRKESIEKHINKIRNICNLPLDKCADFNKSNSSIESFVSTKEEIEASEKMSVEDILENPMEELGEVSEKCVSKDDLSESNVSLSEMSTQEDFQEDPKFHSSNSMDILNANSEEKLKNDKNEELRNMVEENFKIARKNRDKVMNMEMGFTDRTTAPKTELINKNFGLTDAQKNKLRVMSSEFGIEFEKTVPTKMDKTMSSLEINKKKVMTSSCFPDNLPRVAKILVDNENFLNKNSLNIVEDIIGDHIDVNKNESKEDIHQLERVPEQQIDTETMSSTKSSSYLSKKSNMLTLNINRALKQSFTSPSEPMSVGWSPMSEMNASTNSAEYRLKIQRHADYLPSCSLAPTPATNCTDEGFNFDSALSKTTFFNDIPLSKSEHQDISKNGIEEETKIILPTNLKLFLQQSVEIPLLVQSKLVDNELLKYYINELQLFNHLNSLRSYFFLCDGEFGRNITEGLFEKLYDVNFPIDLINLRTLQDLVYRALNSSCKFQEHSNCLSFKINNLPKTFNLCDPSVLDCLSLTYQVKWPLNILLPSDTIGKYDEVFKFLLKLHRVSWVLKKIFEELKFLAKEVGSKAAYLMLSPQYIRMQQCRHIMTNFVQTLQSYIVGEVLQVSWEIFEKDLSQVTNLNELYSLHTNYIKNILFRCLLNQRSAPIKEVLQKIFCLIFKFYDYLRSQNWDIDDILYVHPNYLKLESIYKNFEEFVIYFCKVCKKVGKSGYQPNLIQLLDMLDINNYYSDKINTTSSMSSSC